MPRVIRMAEISIGKNLALVKWPIGRRGNNRLALQHAAELGKQHAGVSRVDGEVYSGDCTESTITA